MKISLSNLASSLLIILIAIYSVGCASQNKGNLVYAPQTKVKPTRVPQKFQNELKKLERSQSVSYTKYLIKKGDTVWSISKRYGVSPDTIIRTNKISDVTDIEIGQTLFVPVFRRSQTQSFSRPVIKRHLAVSNKGFVWPIRNRILSRYGDYKNGRKNTGIDIEARIDEDVLAAKDGKVIVLSNNKNGWGKTIVLEHAQNMHTWYAYNSRILVKKGEHVKRGQVIAKAGKSGNSDRAKLHFKLFSNDKPVNPVPYLPR